MIFGRRKKERIEERKQITNNQVNKFHIEQFKKKFETNSYTDYKESLQNLVNELVYADLKGNSPSGLPSKDQR